MKIEVDNVKGFQDYIPQISLKKEEVKKIIENKFKVYGFRPIETPIIEFEEFIRGENLEEDEAVSDRFRLRDRVGRNIGLRHELNFQLARVFKQNPGIKLPLRVYQIGPVFRDELVGPGKFRQFTQCNVNVIGESGLEGEFEVISIVSEILKELGIDFELQINNRVLLKAIIESVQINEVNNAMRELNKLSRLGEDMVKLNLKKYADANQILTLFKLMEKNISFFVENAFDGAKELKYLIEKCIGRGIKIRLNTGLVGGFSYYTGNVLKFVSGKTVVAGGGRYDGLVGKYSGRQVQAIGISLGLERATDLANIKVTNIPAVILISLGHDIEINKMSKKLRQEGVSCIVFCNNFEKSLDFARNQEIPYAVIIGDNEIAENKVKLKDIKSGEEKLLLERSVVSFLKKI